MFVKKYSNHLNIGTLVLCSLAPALIAAAMTLGFVADPRNGLINPDSYMRLVRLRDMLDTHQTLSAVARDASGGGTILHWSHLIDSLLVTLATPLTLFMSPHDALQTAARAFGPMSAGAAGLAAAWAAAPFAERRWLVLASILPPLSPAIASYDLIGVVHHHVLAAAVAVTAWGWAARILARPAGYAGPVPAGLALGAWAGVGIWLTPETLPLTMMAFGGLGLAWILYPQRTDIARAIAATGLAFLLVTGAALLVDPPAAGLTATEFDRVSIVFAGLALAVAAAGCALRAAHRQCPHRPERAAAALAIAGNGLVAWAWYFKAALGDAALFGDMPAQRTMFEYVTEMLPVRGLGGYQTYLLSGALTAALLIVLAWRRKSPILGYAAGCAILLLLEGQAHVRFAAYPEMAGAAALPIAITLAGKFADFRSARWRPAARLAALLLFLQAPVAGLLIPAFARTAEAADAVRVPACRIQDGIPLLLSHPGAVIMAEVSDTPEILYGAPVRTVGSLYHRNSAAFLRLNAAWRAAASATVPPEVMATEASHILLCKGPTRTPLVQDLPFMTLYDQLRTGNTPPWLRAVAENPVSGHVLYEIVGKS